MTLVRRKFQNVCILKLYKRLRCKPLRWVTDLLRQLDNTTNVRVLSSSHKHAFNAQEIMRPATTSEDALPDNPTYRVGDG